MRRHVIYGRSYETRADVVARITALNKRYAGKVFSDEARDEVSARGG